MGGTKNGYIVMWKCRAMTASSPDSADGWEALPVVKSHGPNIIRCEWAGNMNSFGAIYGKGVTILNHTILKKKMKDNLKMIQTSNKCVEVRVRNKASQYSDYQVIMELGMNIRGIDCCDLHVLFWNGKFAQVYEINVSSEPELLGNFECHS